MTTSTVFPASVISLFEALSMPGLSDIDLSPERVEIFSRTVDLS
jgi:hypothetical protein